MVKHLIFPTICLSIAALCAFSNARLSAEVARLSAPPTVTTALNAQEAKIAAYLRSAGGLYPELIASAAMTTSLPEMAAAIALVESNCNPYAIGDGGASRGAWQVQNRHWSHFAGPVSADPYVQAAQHDEIFSYLLETRSLVGAIWAYNGGSSRYVEKVYSHYLKLTKLTNT